MLFQGHSNKPHGGLEGMTIFTLNPQWHSPFCPLSSVSVGIKYLLLWQYVEGASVTAQRR